MPDTPPITARWPSVADLPGGDTTKPGLARAMLRGALGTCPNCGKGPLFSGWLGPQTACTHCAAPLGRFRADDAPPYFVIFIVAHVVIGAQVALDGIMTLSLWTEAAIFIPLTVVMALGLLRPVKGATIGLMFQYDMSSAPDTQAGATARE